jgi:hypothetical protein
LQFYLGCLNFQKMTENKHWKKRNSEKIAKEIAGLDDLPF